MTQKERVNFYRFSSRIVDHTKEAYVDLIDLHLSNINSSFEDFINKNQHAIYHFCYNRGNCCQCSSGYLLPPNRVLHPPQLDVLLDKHGPTLPNHHAGRWTSHCCRKAKPGLQTDVLDVTLARFLLINFCADVFWYSCLAYAGLTLCDFLNNKKHDLFHLLRGNTPCCACQGGYVFPVHKPILNQNQWTLLFGFSISPCNLHVHMPTPTTICCVAATAGINVSQIDGILTRIIHEHVCDLRKAIDTLIQLRNEVYGHAKEAKISDSEYNTYLSKADSALLLIARICSKERDINQKLSDLDKRPLDETLLIDYQTKLLEQKDLIEEVKVEMDTRLQHIESRVDVIEKSTKTQLKYSKDSDVEKRRKALQDMTKAAIKAHIKEGTFVSTNAVVAGVDSLLHFGVALVIGRPGAGKTRIGLELLHQLTNIFTGYNCLQLYDFTEWEYLLTTDEKCIVFLDDIFGRTNLTYDNNRDYKYIDIISTFVQIGCVKVVITSREHLKQKTGRLFLSHRLFTNIPEINLGSVLFEMNKSQRRECLVNYFERNNIVETDDNDKENITKQTVHNNSTKLYIHSKTVNEIVNLDPSPILGFPESCFLFASNRRFTSQGVSFFGHANEILCDEIVKLREKGNNDPGSMMEYILLVYVFLNGELDLEFVNLDQVAAMQNTIYPDLTVQTNRKDIHDSVKRLSNHFLTNKYEFLPKRICFQHRTIFEAVAISYATLNSKNIINSLDFDFILEFTRPANYICTEGEVTYAIPERMYNILAHRLLVCLKNYRNDSFCFDRNLPISKFDIVTLFCPFDFVKKLCGSLIIKLTGTQLIHHLCHLYKALRPNITHECYGYYIHKSGYNNEQKFQMQFRLTYFDLPVALLLFCDDSEDVMSYLLDEIHKILSSKEKAYSYLQCKRAVTETFIATCLSSDAKKVKILWQIIKSLRIQVFSACDSTDCRNNVENGIRNILYNDSKLKLFMETVDDFSLFDLDVFQSELLYLYGSDSMIVSLLQTHDPLQFNVLRAIHFACYSDDLQLLEFLFSIYEQRNIDFKRAMCYVITGSDRDSFILKIVKLFTKKFGNSVFTWDLIAKQAVNTHSRLLMEFVVENIDRNQISLKSLMGMTWGLPGMGSDFLSYLLETFNEEQIDMTIVLSQACTEGGIDLVKSLLDKYCQSFFDMPSAIMNTFGLHVSTELEAKVRSLLLKIYKPTKLETLRMLEIACTFSSLTAMDFLLETFYYDLLNIQDAMDLACRRNDSNLVRDLFMKFGNDKFDIRNAFYFACRADGMEVIKMFLKTFDNASLDIKSAVTVSCRNRNIYVLMFLLEHIDHSQLDSSNLMIIEACRSGSKEKVQFLFELFECKMVDINSCIQKACLSGNSQLVLYLQMRSINETEQLDYKTMVDMVCRSGDIQMIEYVLKNVPDSALNINYAFSMACLSGNLHCIEYLLEEHNFKTFDMTFAMNMACLSRDVKVIQFLLDNFSDRPFDIASAMNNACLSESMEPIVLLNEKYPHTSFNLKEAMNLSCLKRNIDGVQYLLATYDLKYFDLATAFNNACGSGAYDIVLLLLQKIGPGSCDLNAALVSACSDIRPYLFRVLPDNYFDSHLDIDLICGKRKVINFFLGYFDHRKYELKHAFCEACGSGILQIVQLMAKSVDRSRLGLKLAMNQACKTGNKDIAEFLVETFGLGAFDIKSAVRKAWRHGHMELVELFKPQELVQSSRQRHKSTCTIN